MPYRFREFKDEELQVLRRTLEFARRFDACGDPEVRENLDTELEHEQVQRKHRQHREALPA